MRSNDAASWPTSSGSVVDDRLVEGALGDPVGGALQAAEPAGVDRRDGEPEHDRDQERGDASRRAGAA